MKREKKSPFRLGWISISFIVLFSLIGTLFAVFMAMRVSWSPSGDYRHLLVEQSMDAVDLSETETEERKLDADIFVRTVMEVQKECPQLFPESEPNSGLVWFVWEKSIDLTFIKLLEKHKGVFEPLRFQPHVIGFDVFWIECTDSLALDEV